MLTYLTRRVALGLLTIWAVSVLSFVIIQLPPGDYVSAYVAQLAESGTTASEQGIAALRAEYGLDQPMIVQYGKWVLQMAQGNFGLSLAQRRPVADVIGDRLALTMVITMAAILFTWLLAIPIGIYSAVRQYSIGDYLFTFVGFIGLAVPSFLLALVMMYVGLVRFHANVGGLFSPEYLDTSWSLGRLWDLVQHLPIPAVVLGLAGTAQLVRILRATLLDEIRRPYVITARAKGLSEWQAIRKYPVRVALNPFASTVGFLLPEIVSGTIIVSIVLSLPTMGPLLLSALLFQDMNLAGAIVMLIGVLTVVGMLLSDLLLVWLDPRIRLFGGR